ncbi:hypothetical protein ACN2EN_08060 [Aliarcobacter lanthieri]|uniref:hypothetical protein n=1 Tax=Aliarcobacter lanthieri TaxID=1355374 RepID=UPI003AAA9CD5
MNNFFVEKREKILFYMFYPIFLIVIFILTYQFYDISLWNNEIKYFILNIVFLGIVVSYYFTYIEYKFFKVMNYNIEIDDKYMFIKNKDTLKYKFSFDEIKSLDYINNLIVFELEKRRIPISSRLENYKKFLELLFKNYKRNIKEENLYITIGKRKRKLTLFKILLFFTILPIIVVLLFAVNYIILSIVILVTFLIVRFLFNIIYEIRIDKDKIVLNSNKEIYRNDIINIEFDFFVYKGKNHYINIKTVSGKNYKITNYDIHSLDISIFDLYLTLYHWKFKG